jgi:hypothetical protein
VYVIVCAVCQQHVCGYACTLVVCCQQHQASNAAHDPTPVHAATHMHRAGE